jgi:ribosome biogenesis GTPase
MLVDLIDLGWDDAWQRAADAHPGLAPARIAVEHRGAYEALGAAGTVWAELRGVAYHAARDKRELPTVGDWVMLGEPSGAGPGDASAKREPGVSPRSRREPASRAANNAAIEHLLPRRTSLVRAAAGERTEPQPIAANVDVAFVVTSANLDFNARRLERYLAAVGSGGAAPVLVLNKIDLVDDPAALLARMAEVAAGAPVVAMSAIRGEGVDTVRAHLARGRTGVVVGSSGVGKSTLLNQLLGAAEQTTLPVRADDDRGRHATTRRELFVLDGGGILIDTPGMRELKPWMEEDEELGFDDIETLAAQCKFADCTHEREPGCAVRGAVPDDRLAAWKKLTGERAEVAGRRSEAAKRREKAGARALRQRLREKGRKD